MKDSSLLSICGFLGLSYVVWIIFRVFGRFVQWYITPLNQIPGPKSNSYFWLGSFREVRHEPFMQPHKRWWMEAGVDVPLVHYTGVLGKSSLLVLDKSIVRAILTAPAGKTNTRFNKPLFVFLTNTIGNGLVTLEGEDWQRHRRILQPAFKTGFLRERLNTVVPSSISRFLKSWQMAAESSREIDASSHISALTLDIVGEVAFSHNFKGLKSVEEWATKTSFENESLASLDDAFMSSLNRALKLNLMTIVCTTLKWIYVDRFLNSSRRHARHAINRATDQIIANAELEGTNNPKSLLHLMLVATDPEQQRGPQERNALSKMEIRDEIKTFVMAGHETTSSWIYLALYAMAIHPDVQDRLYEEICEHSSADSDIFLEQVEKMEYLNAFMQEVLRMYPPVGMMIRENATTENFAGYQVPPKTRIVIPPFILHRHPLYWDDPDVFRPERWINVSEEERNRRRFAYLPFSAGGRNCIGQNFATFEALMIVAPLVRAFCIQVAPSQRNIEFTFTSFVTMKTKPNLKIVVKKR